MKSPGQHCLAALQSLRSSQGRVSSLGCNSPAVHHPLFNLTLQGPQQDPCKVTGHLLHAQELRLEGSGLQPPGRRSNTITELLQDLVCTLCPGVPAGTPFSAWQPPPCPAQGSVMLLLMPLINQMSQEMLPGER